MQLHTDRQFKLMTPKIKRMYEKFNASHEPWIRNVFHSYLPVLNVYVSQYFNTYNELAIVCAVILLFLATINLAINKEIELSTFNIWWCLV